MRSSCLSFLITITLDLSFFFHTATHSSLTHSLTYNDSSDNKSVLSINFMFIFFLLISSAWCGKIFTHATSPALSKGEAVTVTVSGDTVPRSSVALVLPPLPYAYDALKPYLGEETLRIHHDKHHAKYVATTNTMIAGTGMEGKSVEDIIRYAYDSKLQSLFNNAAQSYNHEFYWKCMKPNGGGLPPPALAALIDSSFGSFQEFCAAFATAGNTLFGSGWVWLVWEEGKLSILPTGNAGCPLTSPGTVPLLTMDVWEHAYYLHYTNVRPDYVNAFLDNLVNWDFVADQLPTDK